MDRCEQNTDRIIDALTGNMSAEERIALDEHIATCAACQRDWSALADVWDTMKAVEVAPASHHAADIPPAAPAAPRGRRWTPGLAVAASLIIGLVGGYLAGSTSTSGGIAPGATENYLLLLRQPNQALGPDVPPESALVREYGEWAGDLARRDALVAAERLDDDDVRFLDGSGPANPLTRMTAPHISGFFLVRATGLDEAMDIAQTIPHLRYGGSLEVRAIARN